MKAPRLRYGPGGLIPAVIQDRVSGRVLTVAYMNRRALRETLRSGRTVFWSRSRRRLWRKGDTSGNVQRVRAVAVDCDRDALLVLVEPRGPACHTGRESCFFEFLKGRMPRAGSTKRFRGGTGRGSEPGIRGRASSVVAPGPAAILEELDALIRSRRRSAPRGSYTARLMAAGVDRILRKVGEETAELLVAGKNRSRKRLAEEAADLLYHLLVLLAARGVGLAAPARVLERRRKEAGR